MCNLTPGLPSLPRLMRLEGELKALEPREWPVTNGCLGGRICFSRAVCQSFSLSKRFNLAFDMSSLPIHQEISS